MVVLLICFLASGIVVALFYRRLRRLIKELKHNPLRMSSEKKFWYIIANTMGKK